MVPLSSYRMRLRRSPAFQDATRDLRGRHRHRCIGGSQSLPACANARFDPPSPRCSVRCWSRRSTGQRGIAGNHARSEAVFLRDRCCRQHEHGLGCLDGLQADRLQAFRGRAEGRRVLCLRSQLDRRHRPTARWLLLRPSRDPRGRREQLLMSLLSPTPAS